MFISKLFPEIHENEEAEAGKGCNNRIIPFEIVELGVIIFSI